MKTLMIEVTKAKILEQGNGLPAEAKARQVRRGE